MSGAASRRDRVVVVGAGLGGLSAALHLAGAGRQVTVVERESVPGGRAGLLVDGDFAFDTGPTVLTMPDILAEAFAAVGEELSDWLALERLDPIYSARFADGTQLDVRSTVDGTADSVAALAGARAVDGYRRFVDFVTELHRLEMHDFIDRNFDSPFGLLRPSLARLVALGAFRRLAPKVASFFPDERLQRIFSFQAMYAGVSPFDALALYAVISYMDVVGGVFFPRGGMHGAPRAMADAAVKHGVTVRFGETVTSVEVRSGRAVAVHTAGGDRLPCDALVLNPDLPAARRLLGRPVRRQLRYSPSCFLLLAGARTAYADSAHHTISFGHAWRQVFDEIFGGRLMSDPSFLVSAAANPAGVGTCSSVLFPTPNLSAPIDWRTEAPRYRDQVIATLAARGFAGFGDGVSQVTTPLDWAERGMECGTPFASSHTFWQTGPFRPRNRWGDNVAFAGSGTTPGVGVPMVLLSGRLAAERLLARR